MELGEFRQDIAQLVTAWFAARVTGQDARKVININSGGFDNAAQTAHKIAHFLHDQLVDSEGIDEHKIAAAIAFSVGQNFSIIIKFASPGGIHCAERNQQNLKADCALSVFLAMLSIDRQRIENEPITLETLRALFLLTSTNQFPGDTRTAILLALSTLGFLLEQAYPLDEE